MGLPNVTEKHECEQSVALVGIIEELRVDIERLSTAVEYHRNDAEQAKARVSVLEAQARERLTVTR